MTRNVVRAVGLGIVETLPLVGLADVNNDGSLQVVLGPQPTGTVSKKLAQELPDRTVSVGAVVLVLGVR